MPCLASSCLVPASHRVASRRGLLPLIGWASCFKSTSHSRYRRLRFLSQQQHSSPLLPPFPLQLCHLHAGAPICVVCACPASLRSPCCAPSAAAASLLNGVLSQSIGAAANQCFKLPPWQRCTTPLLISLLPLLLASLSWQCS